MRLVVVGGVAAGTKAASRARRVAPELKITLYQEEPEVSISECGLPYFLSGTVSGRERLVARTPEEFARMGIEVRTRHRVERIDPASKGLLVRDLRSGETFEDSYDRLIVATGARAVVPPVEGTELEGVFTLRFLTDADRILRYLEDRSPKRAVVVGGGYIGLEASENLRKIGLEVTLVQAGEHVAPTHDPEFSELVERELAENGVEVHTGRAAEGFYGEAGRLRGVRLAGRCLDADLALVGVGIEPEVTLAREAGAKIGRTGAIRVDRHMKTSLPDVWAAGDCVETTNLASGLPVWAPFGDTANQMGRVVGTNAATGRDELEFPGVLATGIFRVFELPVAKTGLSEREAQQAGFETVCATIGSTSRAAYYPGAEKVTLKLVADGDGGTLLGAQAAGDGADRLVDVCATAIWGRLGVADLVNLDLAYAPPFGPALSPVIQAASVLSGRI